MLSWYCCSMQCYVLSTSGLLLTFILSPKSVLVMSLFIGTFQIIINTANIDTDHGNFSNNILCLYFNSLGLHSLFLLLQPSTIKHVTLSLSLSCITMSDTSYPWT